MTKDIVDRQLNLSDLISTHFIKTTYDDLPMKTVEAAKISILDTLGVILAASSLTAGVREVVDIVKEAGGKKESSILAYGGKVPAWMAAFANGAMVHGLDYDDFHPAALHPSGPIVPACLALSERRGEVTGKEFITAVVLGTDLACRLGMAIRWKFDWYITAVFGTLSSAAASAKILSLDQKQFISALGIALFQAGFSHEIVHGVGCDLRGLALAFPAKAGVLSALMAQRGVTGPSNSFEGKSGLFNLFFAGDFDRDKITTGLGERFEGENVCLKPWPCCAQVIPYVEATLRLMGESRINSRDIDEIEIVIGSISQTMCEPLEARRRPRTLMDARLSLPFGVALAATRGRVTLADFTKEGLEDTDTLAMAQKVKPQFDASLDAKSGIIPGRVVIRTRNGHFHPMTIEYPRGYPQNPLGWDGAAEKFRDCASHSITFLSKERIETAVKLVRRLEELTDIAKVINALVPEGSD